MSVALWRIAADTWAYAAGDLSGGGAKATGGRWNAVDHAVVYASATRALACLETFVNAFTRPRPKRALVWPAWEPRSVRVAEGSLKSGDPSVSVARGADSGAGSRSPSDGL